jgi:hypothetical protein
VIYKVRSQFSKDKWYIIVKQHAKTFGDNIRDGQWTCDCPDRTFRKVVSASTSTRGTFQQTPKKFVANTVVHDLRCCVVIFVAARLLLPPYSPKYSRNITDSVIAYCHCCLISDNALGQLYEIRPNERLWKQRSSCN